MMDDKFKGQSKEDVLRYVDEQETIRKSSIAAISPSQSIEELAKKAIELAKPANENPGNNWLAKTASEAWIKFQNAASPQAIFTLSARNRELEEALRQAPCPVPVTQNELEAGQCFDKGNCGCVYGAALRWPALTPSMQMKQGEG